MKAWLCLLCVVLAGCSAPKTPVSGAPPPVRHPAPPRAAPQAAPVSTARAFDESLLTGREFLLELAGAPVLPRDPELGELNGDPEVVRAVETLFAAAAAGDLDPATLVPRWAPYLRGWARQAKADGLGPGTVRVGRGRPETAEGLLVPVRHFGASKVFSGWVVLVRADGAWLVSDVQTVSAAPRQGPLDPEAPRSLSD